MKTLLALALALAATVAFSPSQVQAQDFGGGGWGPYSGPGMGPGAGFRRHRRGLRGYWPAWNDFYNPNSFNRPETQPYFAMNPPVYYSDQIVPRPMGISPFPVPPGVVPVEMGSSTTETVINPYFKPMDQPVAGQPAAAEDVDSDT